MSAEIKDEKKRLIIDTGVEDWPQPDVQVEKPDVLEKTVDSGGSKDRIALLLTILFGGLLTLFVGYSMSVGNQEILSEAFELVKVGLVASIAYGFGRKSTG